MSAYAAGLVLPGGFAIALAEDGGVIIGRLPTSGSLFEQLKLCVARELGDAHEGREP